MRDGSYNLYLEWLKKSLHNFAATFNLESSVVRDIADELGYTKVSEEAFAEIRKEIEKRYGTKNQLTK